MNLPVPVLSAIAALTCLQACSADKPKELAFAIEGDAGIFGLVLEDNFPIDKSFTLTDKKDQLFWSLIDNPNNKSIYKRLSIGNSSGSSVALDFDDHGKLRSVIMHLVDAASSSSRSSLVDFNADGVWDLRVTGSTKSIWLEGKWREIVSYKKNESWYYAKSQEGQEYRFNLSASQWTAKDQ